MFLLLFWSCFGFHSNSIIISLLFLPFFIGQTDLGMSLVSGYTLMLGDFDLESYGATYSKSASIALFMVFMYMVNLLMLNLLIAIMGDIFDQIQENAR